MFILEHNTWIFYRPTRYIFFRVMTDIYTNINLDYSYCSAQSMSSVSGWCLWYNTYKMVICAYIFISRSHKPLR